MEKLINRASRAFRVFSNVAMVLLFVNVAIIIANIVMRRFFNAPIYGMTELVRYISLFVASFAIVENEWVDGNVSMTMVVDALHAKARCVTMFVANLATTVAFVVLDYLLIQQMVNKYRDMSMTVELRIRLWIPCAALVVGFVALTVVLALKTYIWAWMRKTGQVVKFSELGRR